MKNLLKVFAVAVAIVLAACSKDSVEAPAVPADEAQVTFTTTIPGATEGRAIADGSTVDKLYYAVYEHGQTAKLIDGTETISGKTATVNVTLVSGLTYDIVFWAQKEGAPYTFNTTDNRIDIDWTNLKGNNEARDAFIFVRKALEVNGSIQETITLKRPFAQLNIGISDFEAAATAGFTLAETKVSVDSYDKINFFGGEAYSKADGTGDYGMPAGQEVAVEFACAAPMTGADETINIKGKDYKYVSMNYILPAMPTDAYDVDITFYTTNKAKSYVVPTFTGVTFERNHRTNIMGSLLTDPGKFVIEIDEEFDEPAHIVEEIHMVYDESKSAEANGASLYEAIKNAGNDAVIYLSPGIYMGTDGMTARYTNSNNITIIGVGEGVILAGAKYGRVFDCENPAGATFTLKNVTLKTDHVWAAAVYAKNYATVNLYDVKTVNAGTTAILLDACNMINGVHPGDQKTYVNAYGVTIEAGDLVELNANPCNAYPTASPTEAHFTFDNACTNINIVQPQSVCINQGNNLFVNGQAIPVDYRFENGAMVPLYKTIASGSDLAQFAAEIANGNDFAGQTIKLKQDITLSGEFEPIAQGTRSGNQAVGTGFKGIFDGGNKTISGLTITAGTADDAVGFFGIIDGGEVKNVTFTDVNINVPNCENAGAVAGLLVNGGKVSGVTVSGSITAKRGNGGIVGRLIAHGEISNCVNNATLTATGANVGGIVGAAYYTANGVEMTISNCINNGAINSTNYGVGGIVGLSSANVIGCTNTATVTGAGSSIGGVVGEQQNAGSVINCTNEKKVTNNGAYGTYGTGGIVGWIRYNGAMSNYPRKEIVEVSGCVNYGSVESATDAGGIVGVLYNFGNIHDNKNYAEKLTATGFAAGIVANAQFTETPIGITSTEKAQVVNNLSTTVEANITANCKDLYVYDNSQGSNLVASGNTQH